MMGFRAKRGLRKFKYMVCTITILSAFVGLKKGKFATPATVRILKKTVYVVSRMKNIQLALGKIKRKGGIAILYVRIYFAVYNIYKLFKYI